MQIEFLTPSATHFNDVITTPGHGRSELRLPSAAISPFASVPSRPTDLGASGEGFAALRSRAVVVRAAMRSRAASLAARWRSEAASAMSSAAASVSRVAASLSASPLPAAAAGSISRTRPTSPAASGTAAAKSAAAEGGCCTLVERIRLAVDSIAAASLTASWSAAAVAAAAAATAAAGAVVEVGVVGNRARSAGDRPVTAPAIGTPEKPAVTRTAAACRFCF